MKIGVLGPIWYNIPPNKYGGTELVVANLVNQLCKKHDVTLFGPETSRVDKRVRVIGTVNKPLREGKKVDWNNWTIPLLHINKAFDMVNEFDLLHVHLNTTQDLIALPLAVRSKTPVLFTIHFSPQKRDNLEKRQLLKAYSFLPFTSISKAQRRGFELNYIKTIYNGLDIEKYKFSEKADNYFAWMGRMAPWKGAREAIRAAIDANAKLVLIGPYYPTVLYSKKYFNEEIRPLIDNKQIIWKGDIGFAEKTELVRNAKALLNPIRWEEPFGLVMAEAQALGTPVISFKRGAAPELIENGKSGFLVESITEMVAKMAKVDKLDRRKVRKNAEKFSSENMTKGYIEAYEQTIQNWAKYLNHNK